MKKRFFTNLDPRHIHLSLSHAWILGVSAALVGTAAVALGALSSFLGVFEADIAPADPASNVDSFSRDDLSKSVRIIDARVQDFERLKTTPPGLPDPSR